MTHSKETAHISPYFLGSSACVGWSGLLTVAYICGVTLLDMFLDSRGADLHMYMSLGEKELKTLASTWGVVFLLLLFNQKNKCDCCFEN